jgi:hypothetical protein
MIGAVLLQDKKNGILTGNVRLLKTACLEHKREPA